MRAGWLSEESKQEALAESQSRALWDGVIAGLLGAASIAICFLLIDLSNGRPFTVPLVLSALLFRLAPQASFSAQAVWQVLAYSLVHFGAFALLGLVMAWLVLGTRRASVLSLFVTAFIAVSELLLVVFLTHTNLSSLLPLSRWSFLVANVVAVFVMLVYFFARNPGLGGSVFGSWFEILSEGILAGLIGGLTIAIWFLLFDLSMGRPFYTPQILGAALLGRGALGGSAQISAELVFIYSVLHFSAFMVFGVLVCSLFATLERNDVLLGGLFLSFVLFELFFVGFLTLTDEELLRRLSPWKIEVGNLLASAVVLAFLLMRNRRVLERLEAGWRHLQGLASDLISKPPTNG